jgi:hypothetical protein
MSNIRCKTGQACPKSGVYRFDGYVDGTTSPFPHPHEKEIPLAETNIAPPVRSANKGCYWLLIRVA